MTDPAEAPRPLAIVTTWEPDVDEASPVVLWLVSPSDLQQTGVALNPREALAGAVMLVRGAVAGARRRDDTFVLEPLPRWRTAKERAERGAWLVGRGIGAVVNAVGLQEPVAKWVRAHLTADELRRARL